MAAASPRASTTRNRSRRWATGWVSHGEYNIVEQVLGGRAFQLDPNNILVDKVRRILFGKGVSAATIIHVRRALDQAGYPQATIVGSSGFDPQKCQIMGAAKAPLDMVGTGSFLPATLTETYATADIIRYDGSPAGEGRPRIPARGRGLTARRRQIRTGKFRRGTETER